MVSISEGTGVLHGDAKWRMAAYYKQDIYTLKSRRSIRNIHATKTKHDPQAEEDPARHCGRRHPAIVASSPAEP